MDKAGHCSTVNDIREFEERDNFSFKNHLLKFHFLLSWSHKFWGQVCFTWMKSTGSNRNRVLV